MSSPLLPLPRLDGILKGWCGSMQQKLKPTFRSYGFGPLPWPMLITLGLLTLLIALFAGGFWLSTLTSTFAIALASAGIGVLYGRLGLVSLCQYALIGVGGWVALRTHFVFHWSFEFSVLSGGLAATTVGVIWGLPALRLKGLYLALVTLMLAGAFQVVVSANGFPDGGEGFLGRVAGTGRVMMARPLLASSDVGYFIYTAVILCCGLLIVHIHTISKVGRSWALIKRDERMAAAAGINIVLYKVWAFALSGFLSGVGGALIAGSVGQLDGRGFMASESILLFVLSVVGGVHSWLGALVSGFLVRAAPSLLNYLGVNGFAAMIFFGAALIHAFITSPMGLAGQIETLATSLRVKIKS